MLKHTPAPWVIDEESIDLFEFELETHRIWINAHGMHIGYVDGPRTEERKANARLIAAAPDLLDALLAVRAWDVSNLALDIPLEVRQQIQAAIVKATGELND